MHKAAQRYDKLQSNWDLEIFTVKKDNQNIFTIYWTYLGGKKRIKINLIDEKRRESKTTKCDKNSVLFLNVM